MSANNRVIKEEFSEARIAFQRELQNHHPDIAMKVLLAAKESLAVTADDLIGITVGVVAAEFNIIMDGLYSREQIEDMYEQLFYKLRERRKLSIQTATPPALIEAPALPEVQPKDKNKLH